MTEIHTAQPETVGTDDTLQRRVGRRVVAGAERPFVFESGGRIAPLEIAYETYGRSASDGSNVILLCHPLTMSAHAAGTDQSGRRGWFDAQIGPGRALDTDRYFVICPNMPGSCYGSTGPASICPSTGRSYAESFPDVSIRDMVHAQKLLLDQLGVRRIQLVIGASTGGMQALEWTLMYPELVERACLIATSAGPSPLRRGFNAIAREILALGGACGDRRAGLRLARKLAVMNYRCELDFERRFAASQAAAEGEDAPATIETYLEHHGQRIAERFDVDCYRVLADATDRHDVGRLRGGVASALSTIRVPVHCIGITTDRLYSLDEQRSIASRIPGGTFEVLDSPYGHDSFLVDSEQTAAALRGWESRCGAAGRSAVRPGSPAVRARRIGMFGFGTVGRGVHVILNNPRSEGEHRFEITRICVRDLQKATRAGACRRLLTTDHGVILDDASVDIVLELMGGEAEALDAITTALRSGRDVVTANKLVVARHFPTLRALERMHGGRLRYGAAVCGSIPILKIIDQTLASDSIRSIRGILNGSTNHVLTRMTAGATRAQAIAEARERGFLEADASQDLLGYDSAAKLSILAAHAFGVHVPPEQIATEGIDLISEAQLRREVARGRVIKLVAEARFDGSQLHLRVAPRYLAHDDRLATIDWEMNAVEIDARDVGTQCFIGRGAGGLPTATAVVADLLELSDRRAFQTAALSPD